MQAAISAAAIIAGEEAPIHIGRIRAFRRPADVYQPRHRASTPCRIQRAAGSHAL